MCVCVRARVVVSACGLRLNGTLPLSVPTTLIRPGGPAEYRDVCVELAIGITNRVIQPGTCNALACCWKYVFSLF